MRSGGVWGRRDFLKAGALGLAGSALPSALPSTARGEEGAASAMANVKPTSTFEFEEWTLADFANALNSGAHTSVSITRAYLERIEAIDR